MRVEAESAAELIERNRSEPQGLVRLSCPTALLNSWVGPMLTRYMLKYPLVELFIESTNRRVDLLHEGFDIALRVRFPPLENTDMVMKVLGNSTQSVVGSPQFVERLSHRPHLPTSMACRACTGARRSANINGSCSGRMTTRH
ncbi:LysR substrate binding domain-containing protein [Pseudomonas sp. ok266]|nr:LysR substrate binding domain-containing protein [Pseudomonas sp. ok266]